MAVPSEPGAIVSAHELIERGVAVFPCHTVNPDKSCTCGTRACPDPGKHPLTKHGVNDASTDPAQIDAWIREFPWANIAIATGYRSGIDVLDVDFYHGGNKTMKALLAANSLLPETRIARTGSGGLHLYFKHHPEMKNSGGKVGLGIDVRSDGGYVLAPPSRNAKGAYSWLHTFPCVAWPAWLARLALPKVIVNPAQRRGDGILLDELPDWLEHYVERGEGEGSRNIHAFWVACRIVENCGPSKQGRAALGRFAASCVPPLERAEVDHIWRNACTAGPRATLAEYYDARRNITITKTVHAIPPFPRESADGY